MSALSVGANVTVTLVLEDTTFVVEERTQLADRNVSNIVGDSVFTGIADSNGDVIIDGHIPAIAEVIGAHNYNRVKVVIEQDGVATGYVIADSWFDIYLPMYTKQRTVNW